MKCRVAHGHKYAKSEDLRSTLTAEQEESCFGHVTQESRVESRVFHRSESRVPASGGDIEAPRLVLSSVGGWTL